MSEELVKSVQEKLKEETWTRATISNYTKSNLIELAEIVEKAKNENCIDEIKEICDQKLAQSKDSVMALYISGMLGLKKGALDTSALVLLIDIFKKNHKEPLVTYVCDTILEEDPNNKFALRTLFSAYRAAGDEKMWEIAEKIVKIDFEEAEITKLLADHYEEKGNKDTSIEFYKKALLRYVNAKNINALKEVWLKVVGLIPEEIDFFNLVQRKVAKTISEIKAALLMRDVYPYYKDNKRWDTAIDILKQILQSDEKDSWARKEITECFKNKYADHSGVDEYIKSSNLNQSFRNVFEAISDFEKHIAFDAKNFVWHRTWHVGVIRKVANDTLTIQFGGAAGVKTMSLKMAVEALEPLAKDHIKVLKAITKKDVLAKKIKDDKAWALKTIIKSFGNSCDFKKIKAELVPSVLTASEWTGWNSAAKKILESDSTFVVNPANEKEYMVRDHEITMEEKLNNEFKAQKQFFPKIDVLVRYLNDDETDKSNDLFADMVSYFKAYLKAINSVNEQVVASYLTIQKIGAACPALAYQPTFTFEAMYREIENPRSMYSSLKDTKNTSLQEDFLTDIRMLPDWVDQYIKLFPTVLSQKVLDTLINTGNVEKVKQLAIDSFDDYRVYRDAILFFFENSRDADWFKEANIPLQKQLIAIVNIIAQTYREMDNHVDTTGNRKINKTAQKLIFESGVYADYMLSSDKDTMTHMYTLVDDIPALEQSVKSQLRNKILEKYPDYKFHKTEEKASAPAGMLVTAAKLTEKRALQERMNTVDLPAIAKEIAEAKEKGDLKENAEYIAAKEAQHKLSQDLKRLEGELGRAQIFDPTTATTSYISFGTVVTLTNKDEGKDEKYTILGPWESDPDNGVISYMSPFGNAVLNAKAGEDISFKINDHRYNYTVKSIELAKI